MPPSKYSFVNSGVSAANVVWWVSVVIWTLLLDLLMYLVPLTGLRKNRCLPQSPTPGFHNLFNALIHDLNY